MNSRMRRQMRTSRQILNRRAAAPAVASKPCPYCDRIMSVRESIAGACDDCAPRVVEAVDKLPDEAVDAANEHDVDRLRKGRP